MKTILNYLFVLCLLLCAYGCSDDAQFKRFYPEEKQEPFEREEVKGRIRYSEFYKRWIIYPADDDIYFRVGFEDGIVFYIENMKEEYKAFEGDIIFSGVFLYLYYDALLPMNGCNGGTDCYSLQIKDIRKREPEEPLD